MEYFLFGIGVIILFISLFVHFTQRHSTRTVVEELHQLVIESEKCRQELKFLLTDTTHITKEVMDKLEAKILLAKQMLDSLEQKVSGSILEVAEIADGESLPLANRKNTGEITAYQLSASVNDDDKEDNSNSSNNTFQQIYRLADNGLSVKEIAESLNLGQGEVQLILNLRQTR